MRLTTKGRFAVTAMIDLALRGERARCTLAGISERQKISLSYLEQLFGKLRRHNWSIACAAPAAAIAWRGRSKHGSPWPTSFAPSMNRSMRRSAAARKLPRRHRCMTHDLWSTLNFKMYEYLSSVTLADLVDSAVEKSGGLVPSSKDKRRRPRPRARRGGDDKPRLA
jgi:Rrf2 family iron-sulfur cluster assembly transcriptional regulator